MRSSESTAIARADRGQPNRPGVRGGRRRRRAAPPDTGLEDAPGRRRQVRLPQGFPRGQPLAAGNDGRLRLRRYERRVQRAMHLYWEMVEGFYTRPFLEVFFEPRNRHNLPSAVTALLAGELEGGWRIYWRMRLFFWLIKLHSLWPILPTISFREVPVTPPAEGERCPADSSDAEPMMERADREDK